MEMEKMWMRMILVLAVGMSLSACGKKKESSSVGDGNQPAKVETKKTNTDIQDANKEVSLPETSDTTKGKDGSGALPDGAQIKGDKDTKSDKNGQGNQSGHDNREGKGGQIPPKPGTQNPPKGSSPNEISREEVAEMLSEANRYAPASADGLR